MTRLVPTLDSLREASWMTPERARAYLRILLVMTGALALGWALLSRHGLDPAGRPLGADFPSFWTASELALAGHPAEAYAPGLHYAAQQTLFAPAHVGYSAFFYPPIYLLLCLPLALWPYLPALAAWLAAGCWAYWRTGRAWLAKAPEATPALLAFPAVLSTLGHGQNAFLTTALLGGGTLLLDRRPWLAGVCLGALAFKPHLGLLIPAALLAAGRWRTIAAATATVLALAATSLALFGAGTWAAFLAIAPLARAALERNLVGPEKMPSAFAAVRLLGGGATLAYAAQAVVALAAGAVLCALARRRPGARPEGALMAAAALLASPFLLDYDLLLLAVPLAWVFCEARRTGFLPWEKIVLMAGFLLPLVVRTAAGRLGLPLGPPILAAVFLATARRVALTAPDSLNL